MAKRISAVQPNGEILVLEVTPETTGRLLKQQIKDGQHWDELTRCTTSVEIIVGENHFLANDAKVLDAGIAEDTVFTVVFKPNKVICSNKDTITSLGGMVDLQLLLVVEIPHDETQICESAFNRCGTLAHLIIPDSVTRIEDGAFRCSSSLVNLTIPDSVTHIGDAAFADCSALVNLTIPESVTRIEDDAFMGCASLVNLTILSSVEHIGGYAFADCISLVNLTIPDSVTRIEDGAFADCSSLVNLILPDSVIYIGTSAFAGCSALATLSIPDSVTHIGDGGTTRAGWFHKMCWNLPVLGPHGVGTWARPLSASELLEMTGQVREARCLWAFRRQLREDERRGRRAKTAVTCVAWLPRGVCSGRLTALEEEEDEQMREGAAAVAAQVAKGSVPGLEEFDMENYDEDEDEGMQFFSVLDADGALARERDPHLTGNPDSDSDSEGEVEIRAEDHVFVAASCEEDRRRTAPRSWRLLYSA
eukprot:g25790.t1